MSSRINTHIICAFRTGDLTDLRNQDYQDDGEKGSGRALLNALIDSNARNKAVFVTRHFGREELGGRRFELIEEVGKLALETTNVSRIISEAEYRKSFTKEAAKT